MGWGETIMPAMGLEAIAAQYLARRTPGGPR